MAKLKKQNIPFTQIANEVLLDKNLSLKAKGLFCYLFSKPDNWDFSGDRMTKDLKDGRRAVYSGLKELEERGYLERIRNMKTGKMKYLLKFSSTKTTAQNEQQLPTAHFSKDAKQQRRKTSSISNKENTSNKEKKIIKTSSKEEAEAVSYGNKEINKCIEFLKSHLGGSPDGSQRQNRRYAKLLLDRMKKDYPEHNPVDLIGALIQRGVEDDFHGKNITSFKYLYYNSQKIIKAVKGNNSKYIKIK